MQKSKFSREASIDEGTVETCRVEVEEAQAVPEAQTPDAETSKGKPSPRPSPPRPTESFTHKASKQDEGIVQLLRYSQSDQDDAVKQAKEEVEKEWAIKMSVRDLEFQEVCRQKEESLRDNQEMKKVVEGYERTIQQMIDKLDHLEADRLKFEFEDKSLTKENKMQLIREKEQALEDLASVEKSFSDLHKRYDKLKGVVEGLKKNEETMKKCIQEYQTKLKKQEQRYQSLKSHAEEKIESANQEIDRVRKANQTEVMALQAQLKRAETKAASLERTVEQQAQENKELTAICDDLIAKIGGKS
ncbi:TACC2 [Branchiostoma lanceolatum]|uniref:TACC2 protein n=1 Tax=Branchiostoma lanceolatum TaxID=7740 RepID=A0A8J9ZML9_BRALA|nr:TACC2 [Branchiostoma lanceolatum]